MTTAQTNASALRRLRQIEDLDHVALRYLRDAADLIEQQESQLETRKGVNAILERDVSEAQKEIRGLRAIIARAHALMLETWPKGKESEHRGMAQVFAVLEEAKEGAEVKS